MPQRARIRFPPSRAPRQSSMPELCGGFFLRGVKKRIRIGSIGQVFAALKRATQAGFQDLSEEWGVIQQIVPGHYATIFQTNAIWRMAYVGPPTIWQYDLLERGQGTYAPYSICWYGQFVYYYGHDGFYRFDGRRSEAIGAGKIDRWFRSHTTDVRNLLGIVDAEHKRALWACSSHTGGATTYDRILVYSWDVNEWSCVDVDCDFIGSSVTTPLTLEQLDAAYPDGIDAPANQTSFDSDVYKDTFNIVVAVTGNKKLAQFNGTTLPAVLKTGFRGLKDNMPLLITEARPIVDWGSNAPTAGRVNVASGLRDALRLTVHAKDFPDDTARHSTAVLSPRGDFQLRLPGRLFQWEVQVSQGYSQLTELTMHFRPHGRRLGR